MKTARSRRGYINDPNLTYQAEPREVKLRKIINGEANNMEDGVFPTIYTEKKDGVQPEFNGKIFTSKKIGIGYTNKNTLRKHK